MSSGQLLIPVEYLEVPQPAACFLVRRPFWNKSAPFIAWFFDDFLSFIICKKNPVQWFGVLAVILQQNILMMEKWGDFYMAAPRVLMAHIQ